MGKVFTIGEETLHVVGDRQCRLTSIRSLVLAGG